MLISCPECATRYNIPDNQIKPAGRKVKCKKCHHQWHFVPEEEGFAKLKTQPSSTKKKIKSKKKASTTKKPSLIQRIIFTNISCITLASLVLCVFAFFPNMIVSVFPKTQIYYQAVGKIPPPQKATKLSFEAPQLHFNEKTSAFEVQTTLKNLTDKIVKLPLKIQVVGLDAEEKVLQGWQFELATSYLEPSATMKLNYQLNKMKKGISQIELKLKQM